jgi:hypothetical protein
MEIKISDAVFGAFGLDKDTVQCTRIGNGHINATFQLTDNGNTFVLQAINDLVFHNPEIIIKNTEIISDYLKINYTDYNFLHPILSVENQAAYIDNGQYWRLTKYIPNSISMEKASEPKQVFEAARQYAKLTKLLKDCKIDTLQQTIPHFHDLLYRYDQLLDAIHDANAIRYKKAGKLLATAQLYEDILVKAKKLNKNKSLTVRIMHHDTKIGNVLLNAATYEGICVVDLDTLMPGTILSDIGDMMRTCLCPVDESSTEFHKIEVLLDFFEAIIQGYCTEMGTELSDIEIQHLVYAGKYMVMMQAIRFLTDYLNNDKYYPTLYPTQNYDRAKNQFILLKKIVEKEKEMEGIVRKVMNK